MISLFLLAYFFQVLKYWLTLLHSAYITIIPFLKYLITSMSTIFSHAVQAERLIWSLWCLYVCRDVVLLDNCLTEKSITLLDNCLTEKSITYSHTQRNFFLTADLA